MTRQPSEVAAEVVRALRLYRAAAAALESRLAARTGLTVTDQRCLDLLDLHGGRLTAGQLATAASLTTGAITGVVDRLERAGLARRTVDEADRRRVVIVLDAVRRETGRALYAGLVDAERAHLSGLRTRDLEVLRDFLAAEASWIQERTEALQATPEVEDGQS